MSVRAKEIELLMVRTTVALEACDEKEEDDIADELAQAVAHLVVALNYARAPKEA